MYTLLIYDPKNEVMSTPDIPLRITIVKSEDELRSALCRREWDTILTFGEKDWRYLSTQSIYIRKRWIHLDTFPSSEELLKKVQSVYYGYTESHSDGMPLVSIYTPTYNSAEFILQTAMTVQLQTWQNWEWVVVDDGSTDNTVSLLESLRDPRIRIFKFPNTGRIGYLKGAATSLARGEYLVELDHDDFLTVNAIERIQHEFTARPDVGMVYSNCAEWWPGTTTCNEYGADYWKYRDTEWNGITVKESLQHDAMGLCDFGTSIEPVIMHMPICPNHVRAFRASTLKKVGGYRNLVWADDYDLMLRMFIHSEIHHINELLYVQRLGTNTWTKHSSILWPCFEKVRTPYLPQLKQRFQELGLQY